VALVAEGEGELAFVAKARELGDGVAQ
jgi:hypothetical protein